MDAHGAYSLALAGEVNAPQPQAVIYDSTTETGWTRQDPSDTMNVQDIYTALGISPASILTGINLLYQEPNSTDISETEATVQAAIDFYMSMFIPSAVTQNMRNGDTYTVQLPDDVNVIAANTYQLYGTGSNSGVEYGQVNVAADGKITFTFNENVQTLGDATGSFHFGAKFNETVVKTPGEHVIEIPNDPANISTTVNIISNEDQTIDKKGEPDKPYNTNTIEWTVDFNKPAATLTNAVLTDRIPEGLELTNVRVYTVDVDVNGNMDDTTQDDYNDFTWTEDGTVTFTGPVNKAMRVVYETNVIADTSAGGTFNFINNATINADGVNGLSTDATVTTHYGDLLKKDSTSYDPATQTFTWQIEYNYGLKHIERADATLIDTLTGPNMIFDQGTVEIHHVAVDEDGNATVGGLLDAGAYDATFNDANNEMTVTFAGDLDEAVLITYKTKIDGIVDDSGVVYGNDVSTSWGGKTHGSGQTKPSQQQNIIKSVLNPNEVNQTIMWKVDVNLSHYMMRNWSMTDQLGAGVHLVDTDLLSVVDVSTDTPTPLSQPGDYTLTIPEGQDQQFTITFQGDYAEGTDHQFEIVYTTHYDFNAPATLQNTASSHWTDTSDGPHDSTSHVTYPRNPLDVNGGEKYGTYNPLTKEITWYILLNYHQNEINPASMTDTIAGNQKYVEGSLAFYQYIKGTAPEASPPIDALGLGLGVIYPTENNGETLTITTPGGDAEVISTVWVVFRTSLVGGLVNESSTYDNHAFLDVGDLSYDLYGRVAIAHGGELIDKTGQQSMQDGYVHWSAVINASQSTLESVVLTDTPSADQRIDMNSLTIYRTSVDQNGTVTSTGVPLEKGTDYTATYIEDASGTWVLTVAFAGTVDVPYILQYRSAVYLTGLTGLVSNNLRIDSMSNGKEVTNDVTSSTRVIEVEGGGVISGQAGAVTIRKVGVDGSPLAGAVLTLVDRAGNRIGPVTTDENGLAAFKNIVQGTYRLFEVSAPSGYTISPELAAGKTILVNANTTNGIAVEVPNAQTEINLHKVNEIGQPLEGAVFTLNRFDEENQSFVSNGPETYTSGPDGMVRVMGLPEGQYEFVEVSAPDGYILNSDTATVLLEKNANGFVGPGEAGDFINYQGSLEIMKVNGDNNTLALAGAVFTVTGPDGNLLRTIRSGADGIVRITGLAPGDYIINELEAPPGYTPTSDPRRVTIPEESAGELVYMMTAPNNRAEGSVIFSKVDGDTNTGLAGAVFNLINRETEEIIGQVEVTDGGWGTYGGLQPGLYSLVEIEAPEGYILNTTPLDFEVTEDSYNASIPQFAGVVENYQGKIRIAKVDENGNPLANATFTIYDSDGNALRSDRTDPDGIIEIYMLPPGTYTLRETAAPIGYALTSDPFTVIIPESAAGEIPTLRFGPMMNQRMLGTAMIHKVDANTSISLAGAVYQVVRVSPREVIATITTDSTGMAGVSELASGTYEFIEIQAPAGYVLDSTPIRFEITDELQTAIVEVTAQNHPLPEGTPRPTLPPDGPPKTGDTGNGNGPWIALMGIAAFGFIAALAVRLGTRRSKKTN